jgi:hypothetical protein
MARQSWIYSTPEKYTQPCEISLNIAEYTTTFKIYTTTLQTYINKSWIFSGVAYFSVYMLKKNFAMFIKFVLIFKKNVYICL